MSTRVAPVESKLGVSLPEPLAALYAKADGEKADIGGFRLMTIAEVLGAPFEAYLGGARGKALARWGWKVWPFWTNDNSDHICAILSGPLTGHTCLVLHDDESLALTSGDVSTFVKLLKADRKAGGDEPTYPSEYRGRTRATAAVAERDWASAQRLAASFAQPPTFDAEYVVDWLRALASPKHVDDLRGLLRKMGLGKYAALRGEKLLYKVAEGDLGEVTASLDAGVDVNEVDPLYGTILSRAAAYGKNDIIKLALSRGANVNLKLGMGPLELASNSDKSLKTIELLVDAGADMKGPDAKKALENAVKFKASKVEALLRRHGA